MNEDIPIIHHRVDFWLNEWARSLRVKPADMAELDFPTRCKPFIGGGESQRADDFADEQWRHVRIANCATMDALIESLPQAQGCAIKHVYAGDCFRFPRDNLFPLLVTATNTLLIGMNARAVI